MTSFLPGFAAGYLMGIFSAFVLLLVVYSHREPPCPGAEILTEGDRDFLAPYLPSDPPPMPECKPARDADFASHGISYTHLGMTDREDER